MPSSWPTITRCRKSRTWRISSAIPSAFPSRRRKPMPTSLSLRRPFHGRDRQDPEPGQNRRAAGQGRRLFARKAAPPTSCAKFQETNPNFYTVTYINCSADGEGAQRRHLHQRQRRQDRQAAPKDRDLLFVPDENLGAWVMEQTGRPMTLWRGNCYAHVEFRRDGILRLRKRHIRTRKWWCIPRACAKSATWPTRFVRPRR